MSGPIQANQPAGGLVPITRVRRQIEADVALKATDNRFHVDGDVFIGKRFLPTVIKRAMNGTSDLRNVSVTYGADKDRYQLSGEVKFAGMWWKAAGSTRATMDGNDVVLKDVQFDFPGSSLNWLSNKVRDGIAKGLNGEGITAARQGSDIRISGTKLLQEAGVLPLWGRLSDDTSGAVSHDGEGNIAIHFGAGSTGTPDGTSHIKAHLDPGASRMVLKDLLGSQYQMKGAEFENGRIQIKGAAAVPELRDGINAGALLIGLLAGDRRALLTGDVPVHDMPYMPLGLEMRAEGTDVVIKPDTHLAIKAIATELKKGGAPVTTTKDDVRVSAGSMLPEGKVQSMQVANDGLHLEADINVDAVLNPELR
jgi:hypothetical protein